MTILRLKNSADDQLRISFSISDYHTLQDGTIVKEKDVDKRVYLSTKGSSWVVFRSVDELIDALEYVRSLQELAYPEILEQKLPLEIELGPHN